MSYAILPHYIYSALCLSQNGSFTFHALFLRVLFQWRVKKLVILHARKGELRLILRVSEDKSSTVVSDCACAENEPRRVGAGCGGK